SGTVPPGPTATQLPNLVLAIEEPELYQHPNRQRHMARVLHELASGMTPGVAEKTQVIYSTHSPLFVGIDRIEKIRLLRRVADSPGKPNVTRVVSTTLDNVARKLWEADGSPGTEYTGETLAPRLVAVMTPWMSEGFFSEVAVLVEGEDDRAAILGVAKSKGIDLESREICVIPCGGKTNIDKPAAIFRLLGIPCYLVWDGDKGTNNAKPEDNQRLMRLLGQEPEEWPSVLEDLFTCFEKDLESTMRSELGGERFDELLTDCMKEYCFRKKKHAMKSPHVVERIVVGSLEKGAECKTLSCLVDKIVKLKDNK
ncbi:MAG: TOPRIM nucleotidyl transferase/hydrolase domain-containing protein, partial [Bacteroidota bacterium]